MRRPPSPHLNGGGFFILYSMADDREKLDKVAEVGRVFKSTDWYNKVLGSVDKIKEDIYEAYAKKHTDTNFIAEDKVKVVKTETNTGVTITLSMPDYATYIDEGVAGKSFRDSSIRHSRPGFSDNQPHEKPPWEAFLRYSHDINEVFAIRESVFQKGIRPSFFYTDTVTDSRLEQLYQDIAKVTKDQMLIQIKQ